MKALALIAIIAISMVVWLIVKHRSPDIEDEPAPEAEAPAAPQRDPKTGRFVSKKK